MNLEEIPSLDDLSKLLNSTIQNDKVLLVPEVAKNQKQRHSGDIFLSGINSFDNVMNGGFIEGDLVIISGQSGEGKTTFAQTLTYNMTRKGIPCVWFSYEVSIDKLDEKFVAMGIANHYIVYTPEHNTSGSLEWIEYKIKEAWVKYATKVVFIDHIDFLVPKDVKSSENREVMLKRIAIELKSLAIELRVTIILMCHLKKLNERNAEPEITDIGYSAGIYQNADYVFLVMREKLKQRDMTGNSGVIATNIAKIKLVKNRHYGSLIFSKLTYSNGKFNETTSINENDYPTRERNDYVQ